MIPDWLRHILDLVALTCILVVYSIRALIAVSIVTIQQIGLVRMQSIL